MVTSVIGHRGGRDNVSLVSIYFYWTDISNRLNIKL